MLFNSYIFLFAFLPVILILWWACNLSVRTRLALLTLCSFVFYGWWDWRFCSLLLFSTLVDYYAGYRIDTEPTPARKKFWLGISLTTNLGLLAFFKYSGFFAQTINSIGLYFQSGDLIHVPNIILPIGISFYTFQTISYSIDIYRGDAKPANDLIHFAAYVSMFPQLIAGPIVRYASIESQLREVKTKICWGQFSYGIYFFVLGMSQKILLADTIASRINPRLLDYETLEFFGSWFVMLGYTCQLYFDFSGYSNMAVGLGLMLGFQFPQNFNSPYKSLNISEFWRRWHMSLSKWLRDYLFIPLGGSRFGTLNTMRNLTIVMFLGGLWHGAGWNFVVWGLFHGLLLILHQSFKATGVKIPRLLAIIITFVAVVFGWVFFRSLDMHMAWTIQQAMVGAEWI